MDKAVAVRCANGLFVQVLCLDHAPFDPSNLRAYQCGAVFEILRASLRPYPELFVVGSQSVKMVLFLIVESRTRARRMRQRAIKVNLYFFKLGWGRPGYLLGSQRRLYSRSIVASKIARLRLSGKIPTLGERQNWICCQVALKLSLIEFIIVK